MIFATALASFAVALSGPAAAPATLQTDLDAAAAYWGATPTTCSTVSVSSVRMPRKALGEATLAGPGESGPCVMKIARGLPDRLRCLVVVHEYGHWLGHHHSTDRHDAMFPTVNPKRLVVPECTNRAPR